MKSGHAISTLAVSKFEFSMLREALVAFTSNIIAFNKLKDYQIIIESPLVDSTIAKSQLSVSIKSFVDNNFLVGCSSQSIHLFYRH